MMIVSVLVVCVGVPLVFITMGHFPPLLKSAGVHPSPNIAGGYPIAEFETFDRHLPASLPDVDISEAERALAIRRFSVKKVAFRPFSGVGIAPRLNLVFEFEGPLPNPRDSSGKFSLTVIHVYIKAPGKTSGPVSSEKVARVGFTGAGWDYQVIIDGFHEQAGIFDVSGKPVGRGLGTYVDFTYAPDKGAVNGAKRRVAATTITAALPMGLLGDPAVGEWRYYVLLGLADSRHPSMMLHSSADGSPAAFCRAVPKEPGYLQATTEGKPLLAPLLVANNH